MRKEIVEVTYFEYQELELYSKETVYNKFYHNNKREKTWQQLLKEMFCKEMKIEERQLTKFSMVGTANGDKADVKVLLNLSEYLNDEAITKFGILELTRGFNQGIVSHKLFPISITATINRLNLTNTFVHNLLLTPTEYQQLYNIIYNIEYRLLDAIKLVEKEGKNLLLLQLNNTDVLEYFEGKEFYYDNEEGWELYYE